MAACAVGDQATIIGLDAVCPHCETYTGGAQSIVSDKKSMLITVLQVGQTRCTKHW